MADLSTSPSGDSSIHAETRDWAGQCQRFSSRQDAGLEEQRDGPRGADAGEPQRNTTRIRAEHIQQDDENQPTAQTSPGFDQQQGNCPLSQEQMDASKLHLAAMSGEENDLVLTLKHIDASLQRSLDLLQTVIALKSSDRGL